MYIIEPQLTWNGELKSRKSTKYIIVHHAEAKIASLEDIHRWHKDENGWIGIGYNFYIRKDGSVYRGRPLWAEGAHCQGYNDVSVGICFEGDFNSEKMTDEQYKSGVELIKNIRKEYPGTVVRMHREMNKTTCPGANFRNSFIVDAMMDYDPITPPPDEKYANDVNLVAKALGLNSPQYWIDYSRDGNVKRLITLMADFIRAQGGI